MKVAGFFVNMAKYCPFRFRFQISDISFASIPVSKAGYRRFKKEKKMKLQIEVNFCRIASLFDQRNQVAVLRNDFAAWSQRSGQVIARKSMQR